MGYLTLRTDDKAAAVDSKWWLGVRNQKTLAEGCKGVWRQNPQPFWKFCNFLIKLTHF